MKSPIFFRLICTILSERKGEMNIKLNKRLNEGLHARLKDGIDDIRNDNSSLIRNLLIDPSAVNKKNKTRARIALKTVQQSTASMGRFDEMRKGEIASKSISKRQRLRCNTQTNKDKVIISTLLTLSCH